MLAIQNFQQRLFNHYKESLDLPPTYHYFYGNPVQPRVPLETAHPGVCIIGAYPPARLATIGVEQEMPVADWETPFATGIYFDGRRVRTITAGLELERNYLRPLGLRRRQCWLTYLVRVFLFKDRHLARYRRLGCTWPEGETRSRFDALARQGLSWLEEELALARPRLVITLGAEVARVLQDLRSPVSSASLLGGELTDLWLGERVYPVIHLAQPQVVGSPAAKDNLFRRLHWEEHLPAARRVVERLVG